jgi:hypothetical protein
MQAVKVIGFDIAKSGFSGPRHQRGGEGNHTPADARAGLEKIPIIPHARARARRVVPMSELLFGTLTQNQSSLEPSLVFCRDRRQAAHCGSCTIRTSPAPALLSDDTYRFLLTYEELRSS